MDINVNERQLFFGPPPDFYLQNKRFKFPSNFIQTSKYNIITFLPQSLLTQFSRVANFYFLIIGILSCFPAISSLSPLSAFAPLVFVILLSMVRDGYEDYQRHKQDNEMNSSPATIRVQSDKNGFNGFQQKTWKDVKVGDFVLVKDNEIISSDLVVIASALNTGLVYIETSSLDGEKNLKQKQAVTEMQDLMYDKLPCIANIPENFNGKITCLQPNAMLYAFDGVLIIDQKKYALTHKHLILRGSRLKNLKWALGLVVYTGKDTKIMRNADEGGHKLSNIDKRVNFLILCVLLIQILLCTTLSVVYKILCDRNNPNFSYFDNETYGCTVNGLVVFAEYFLLLNTFIPISLIVSLEFVKVAQGHYMMIDKDMYSQENDRYVKVFSSSINEELGQVQYIFTDKTGTLTCNRMEFKLCVCGSITYGDLDIFTKEERSTFVQNQIKRMSPNSKLNRKSTFTDEKAGIDYNFDSIKMDRAMIENDPSINFQVNYQFHDSTGEQQIYKIDKQSDLIKEILMLLATAHECVLEQDQQEIRYQGPSPDEIALVDAARRMGYTYTGISMNKMLIQLSDGLKEVDLLRQFEFNSDRKRMSVIVRHNGVIKVYVKGADSIIKDRLSRTKEQPFLEEANQKLDFFSKKGLRTLCLALKILTEREYQQFSNDLDACIGQNDSEKKQQKIIDQMEQNFMLLGVTAVEDKLQDDVPETLADLLKANINVWMLTGDKLETAENIGRSCNLIQSNMRLFYITPEVNASTVLNEIRNHVHNNQNEKRAVLIEGVALTGIQHSTHQETQLVELAPDLHSVICCRVTPKQKADMVRLVKDRLKKITIAVGDGANDVNMILEANIGIGIYGQEGMRAVQSSNYAIGQFKCLWKLTLFHGRMNYIRISEMILYFFYKNIIFTVPQFFFAFYNQFSGQTIFDDFYITLYNTVFTFWPVVIRAVFDEDIFYTDKRKSTITGSRRLSVVTTEANEKSQSDILKEHYPRLYYIGQKNKIFTNSRFFKWFFIGVLQGACCFYSFFYEYRDGLIFSQDGYTSDIWFQSISIFTAIMILVTLKLAINTQFWTILTWVAYLGTSLGSYFAYVFISSALSITQVYKTAGAIFSSPIFYFDLLLSVLAMFTLDLTFYTMKSTKDTLLNYFKKQARSDQHYDIEKIHQLNLELDAQIARENQIQIQKQLKKNQKKNSQNNSELMTEQSQTDRKIDLSYSDDQEEQKHNQIQLNVSYQSNISNKDL